MLASHKKLLEFKTMISGKGRTNALLRRCAALSLSALTILALTPSPAVAAAQVSPVARPAVLTEIKLLSESRTQARFELTFDPAVTADGPSMGPANQPAVSFPFTNRGPRAVQPASMKGLVRS